MSEVGLSRLKRVEVWQKVFARSRLSLIFEIVCSLKKDMKNKNDSSVDKSKETQRKDEFLKELTQTLSREGVRVEVKEDVVLFTKGKITIKRKFKGGRLA